jgi:hypothetical protein
MKLANIAFHVDTPGRFSVLGKQTRKANLKEKVENLFDENKGKRSILRRYLGDAVRQLNYVEIDEISDISEADYYVDTMDPVLQESAKISVNVSEKHLNPRTCWDMRYIQDKDDFSNSSNSSSSTQSNEYIDIDLVRMPGDGTEVPDSADDKSTDVENGRSEREVTSKSATGNENAISEEAIIKKADRLVAKNEKVSDSKPMYCEYNALSETRKPLKHKPMGNLKGLLNLYKTMKLRKKFAKKSIANKNLTCFTPVKSRTYLNSAFMTDQTRVDGSLSVSGNTQLNLASVRNPRLNSGTIGEKTVDNRHTSTNISNTTCSASSVLDSAFISSDLTKSKNTCSLTETGTFMQERITLMEISDQTRDELNFAKLQSIYENKTMCSSTFEVFAYYNNGFVMD